MSEKQAPVVPVQALERAVKLSYAQAMLGAIYAASTGGMFLIGYGLQLGATDVQIGLMSTVPMLCVVMQLIASALVERGVSRRWLTVFGALLNVLGWVFIIMIPYVVAGASSTVKVWALIAVITLVTLFAHISGNARGSWIGDLIPEQSRGTFFGRLTMYAGIIGAVFAIIEGRFLDIVKSMGIGAFSWLFAFGMLFGLANSALFIPQPDVPLARKSVPGQFFGYVRETFTNRALMLVMVYALFWSMQAIAGPFYATYMLRDLQMPFLGVGIVNAMVTLTMLLSSPFWGRVVDRYGCRPIMVACTAFFVPLPLIWLGLHDAVSVYRVVIPINLLVGFAIAGISVALSTLVYKVTPSAGRSVQFAIYSIIVVLAAAPMPAIGGNLPAWLSSLGIHADLRATFYATIPFVAIAAVTARFIAEPNAHRARELVRNLPNHLLRPKSLHAAE